MHGSTHDCLIFLPAATKLGQGNVFTGVCDSVNRGVCLSACWDTNTPPTHTHNPPEQTPQTTHTPWSRHTPQDHTPPAPGADTPRTRPTHPPSEADSGIRSTSGRYASYWNAFLFQLILSSQIKHQASESFYVQIRFPNELLCKSLSEESSVICENSTLFIG